MSLIKPKRIVITLLMVLMLCGISQAANYFFVDASGIPHLPVLTTAQRDGLGAVAAGTLIYNSDDDEPQIYTDGAWEDLCTTTGPGAGNVGYFQIVGGIPIIPVLSSDPNAGAASGSIYYSEGDTQIRVSNGSVWGWYAELESLALKSGFSTDPDLDVVQIPVRTTDPGGEQGAVYFSSTLNVLKYYDGSDWHAQSCSVEFITRWNMPAESFTLAVQSGEYDCVIDWGDGESSEITSNTDPDLTHNYGGIYNDCNITITGIFRGIKMYNGSAADRNKLTAVVKWGNVGFESFSGAFRSCSNLTTLPTGSDGPITGAGSVESFNGAFYGCASLEAIPDGLFANCKKANSFVDVFRGCGNLTAIPVSGNLFDTTNATGTITLARAFSGCSILTAIPQNLFQKSTNSTSFSGVFSGCSGILEIPPGLFADCNQVTDYSGAFGNCTSLGTGADPNNAIPDNLFTASTKVKTFYNVFGGCSKITKVPEILFNTTDATGSSITFEKAFTNCGISLTAIPENVFQNSTNATSFAQLFYGCKVLDNIPSGLFADCNQVTSFNNAFRDCDALDDPCDIPAGLFDDCEKAANFSLAFFASNNITKIPDNTFTAAKLPNANTFANCFNGCTELVTMPAQNLWDEFPSVDGTGCFLNCTSIPGYPGSVPPEWR